MVMRLVPMQEYFVDVIPPQNGVVLWSICGGSRLPGQGGRGMDGWGTVITYVGTYFLGSIYLDLIIVTTQVNL